MLNEFSRTEMLIGFEKLSILKNSKVAVFGIGGVGSFVVESLARSGISNFVLIDFDTICITNINRQLIATHETIGRLKVDVMKERILSINPNANVTSIAKLYNSESAEDIFPYDADYIVDAIDMVSSKLDIIERSIKHNIKIISSMGTGNKMNPAMLEVSDIHKTSVCPLARVMRKELKNRRIKKLKVIFSKEIPLKPIENSCSCKTDCVCASQEITCKSKRPIPASISFVPSSAGLLISSELIKDLIK